MKLMSQKSPVCLPKGILFDTDNTLYDYLPAHQAATTPSARSALVSFPFHQVSLKSIRRCSKSN